MPGHIPMPSVGLVGAGLLVHSTGGSRCVTGGVSGNRPFCFSRPANPDGFFVESVTFSITRSSLKCLVYVKMHLKREK